MIGLVTALPRRCYPYCGVVLGALASLLALLWPGGDAPVLVAGLACSTAILLAVRADFTKAGAAWYSIAAGTLLVALGAASNEPAHGLGFGDILFTAGLLTLAGGIVLLVVARASGGDWGSVIDTAAATAAAALVIWVTLLAPKLDAGSAAAGTEAASVLYCFGLLVLFALTTRLVLGLRTWTPSAALLCLAVGFLSALAATAAAVRLGELSNVAWAMRIDQIVAFALLAACALHPSRRKLGIVASERKQELTPSRLALLTTAAMTAPVVLFVQNARGAQQLDVLATVVCSIAVVALVIVRLAGLVLRQQRATHRELVLRRAMRSLASASEHDRVCAAIVEAATAIAGEHGHVRASLLLGSGRSTLEFATRGEAIPGRKHESSTPLTLQDERIGELVVESSKQLPDEIRSALKSLSSQAVLALESLQRTKDLLEERHELETELQRRSHLDALTALPNRSYFLERTEAALDKIRRSNEQV